jgi:SAM-dependent methyltransferase
MEYSSGYEKCAHLYDLFDTKDNIGFFAKYAREAGEILDIGAGTGRIAIALAEQGAKVICVEPSPAMRWEFKKKLAHRRKLLKNIEIHDGDSESFRLEQARAAAFMSGSFDHLLDDSRRLGALENIGKHLRPNGILVFDLYRNLTGDKPLKASGKVTVGTLEYNRFVGTRLLPENILEVTLVYETYSYGQMISQIEEKSLVGMIDRGKLHNLLTVAGFEIINEYGGYDFARYKEDDSVLIIEAKKV